MPAPHLMKESEIEWDSKSHSVFNLAEDVIRTDSHRGNEHMPVVARPHAITGAQWTEPSFSLWMAGSGAAGTEPPMDGLFKAAGADHTNTPATSDVYDIDGALKTNFTPVNIDIAQGDLLKIPCGSCAMDLTQTVRPGEASEMAWSGAGTYTEPTEAALSAALETKAHPVAAKGLTVTLANDALVLKEIVINLNNVNNSPHYDIGGTNGAIAPLLTDLDPQVELLAILPAFATANYFADLTGETKLAFSAQIGSVAGNTVTITADLYIISLELTNIDGLLGIRITSEHSWASGDTKLTWTFE